MDFVVKVQKKSDQSFQHQYVEMLPISCAPSVLYIQKLPHLDYHLYEDIESIILRFGDVIEPGNRFGSNTKGFFYTIVLHRKGMRAELFSDLHSFLPLYLMETYEAFYISSSVDHLARISLKKTPDSQFIAEIALFNVPLRERCFFHELRRIPFGRHVLVEQGNFIIAGERRVYREFSEFPRDYKHAIGDMVELFTVNSRHYFDQFSQVALTSGFDSRTMTALAHYYKKGFACFTHGKKENHDVMIPMELSSRLGFSHRFIELNDDYVRNHHLRFVSEYLRVSGGMNGFLYPHFIYDPWVLSEEKNPIITGFCGSELLRNPHFGGAISSQTAINMLWGGLDHASRQLQLDHSMEMLDSKYIEKDTLNQCLADLERYYSNLPSELTLNQKLAVFEFEEVIPKLFGTWIYGGMHYCRIRAPYMDTSFFSAIMKTEVSQVYRRFMEKNPLKRFWGQVLYANIIDKTWPELGHELSGKGYAPADLLSFTGRFRILRGYMGKAKRARSVTYDNLGLISGFQKYSNEHEFGKNYGLEDETAIENLFIQERIRDMALLNASAWEYQKMFV